MSPRVRIAARRLIVSLPRTARGENSAELVFTTLVSATMGRNIFEGLVSDGVEI